MIVTFPYHDHDYYDDADDDGIGRLQHSCLPMYMEGIHRRLFVQTSLLF
jgi:hypothetical protein